jgi:photosystem I subunit 3
MILTPDVSGLIPCKNFFIYQQRIEESTKKLTSRLQKYEYRSPAYLVLDQQISSTKTRFAKYSDKGLLCGTEGLPHLIADGRPSHAGEFITPGIGFLFIAGWIGWVGRSYVQYARGTDKPTEKEIIIDVPVALSFVTTGFVWPVAAFKEFTSGKLIAREDEITVSPR